MNPWRACGYRLAARRGEDAGNSTEWSFACPGNGIAADCCSLLMSVLSFDVVAAGSRVVPAGSTPNTVVLGVMAGAELGGMSALMGAGIFSEHPRPDAATTTAAIKTEETHGR